MLIATRRTNRPHHYHSNGRDYLASIVSWPSPETLEAFLHSVRPHLQHWLRLCYETPHRFQQAVEWINTGPGGYYYSPEDLEEDLLLECLGYGVWEDGKVREGRWSDEDAETGDWITQELWARTIWRIVRDSSAPGNWLAGMREAEAYGFVGEVLCIAFHSLAFRGSESCYWGIIVGESKRAQVAWVREREEWEERFGEPLPAMEARSIQDVGEEAESEESASEVGSEGMAKTAVSGDEGDVGVDEGLNTGGLFREGAIDKLPNSASSDKVIRAWRDRVNELSSPDRSHSVQTINTTPPPTATAGSGHRRRLSNTSEASTIRVAPKHKKRKTSPVPLDSRSSPSGLAEFDDIAAVLNQPDSKSDDEDGTTTLMTPQSLGTEKMKRGIKRPDLDAGAALAGGPLSQVVGGRVLRVRKERGSLVWVAKVVGVSVKRGGEILILKARK